MSAMPAIALEVKNLTVHYGVICALHDVSLCVNQGEMVTLIGANGAGKTTILKAISGLLRSQQGSIQYEGWDISRWAPHEIVRHGLCHVPEGRMVFANLTVLENLKMGAFLQRDPEKIEESLEDVLAFFPRLKERVKQLAGTLSGGEQQMLAIGRALMGRPRLLMLDEPSLGIAPILVKSIFDRILEINRKHGLPIILVEQNASLALELSHRAYVLETGRVLLQGPSADLKNHPAVQKAYLGMA